MLHEVMDSSQRQSFHMQRCRPSETGGSMISNAKTSS